MKKFSEKLYQNLQIELQHTSSKDLDAVTRIEGCYHLVMKYWKELRDVLCDYEFESPAEEIAFFKNCKPMFTSLILYFELLYHIELLRSPCQDEYKNLLLREKHKLAKFICSNTEFYDYYKCGHTCRDELYFLRVNNKPKDTETLLMHDVSGKTTTSHDYLVAEIMALEQYNEYVNHRLKQLENI